MAFSTLVASSRHRSSLRTFITTGQSARRAEQKVTLTEALLAPLVTTPSPRVERIRDLVERIAVDRSILRVDDIARASDLDTRELQRCFRSYVGLSPKSVIRRYRLHEAAIQLQAPDPPALAELAASLRYADQAHFGRDFKRTVGQTPRAFGLGADVHHLTIRDGAGNSGRIGAGISRGRRSRWRQRNDVSTRSPSAMRCSRTCRRLG